MAMEQVNWSGMTQVLKPDQVSEAWHMKQNWGQDAIYILGGTLLRTQWEAGTRPMPGYLISLEDIQEMKGIQHTDEEISIGAAVTLSECLESSFIKDHTQLLRQTIKKVAAPSIRNLGTIGGNVTGLIGDTLPTLLVLDTEISLYRDGSLYRVPIEDWLHDTNGVRRSSDLLVRIHIPIATAPTTYYEKVGRREAFTPSLVTVALVAQITPVGIVNDLKLAAGGGIARPSRLKATESLLRGCPLTPEKLIEVSESIRMEYVAASDVFASEQYRKLVAANLITAQLWKLAIERDISNGNL